MVSSIPKTQAQRRLVLLWFVMAALPTMLLGYNTQQDRFADPTAVWQWFSPYLFPTLLLMVGTLRTNEDSAAAPALSSLFYYRLCMGLSLFYGLALFGTLLNGLTNQSNHTQQMLESLKHAGLMLTGIQGLLNLALGAFFVAPSSKAVASTK